MGTGNSQAGSKAIQVEGISDPFFTGSDVGDEFDFLEKAVSRVSILSPPGLFPRSLSDRERDSGSIVQTPGLARSGRCSDYWTAENYLVYQRHMQYFGAKSGPGIGIDLAIQ
jgi:hypothetical protein